MKIDGINKEKDGSIRYLISGEVDDMSGGAGKGDFKINIEYLFSNDSVREIIKKGDKLPHKIKEMDILRAPLVKGGTWTQTVKINGKDTELKAEIIEDKDSSWPNEKVLKVQYTAKAEGMPDGIYKETRIFREKKGLIYFENTYTNEITFNYRLYY